MFISCDGQDYPFYINNAHNGPGDIRFFRLNTPNANTPGYNANAMTNVESRLLEEGYNAEYLGVKTISEMKGEMDRVSFIIIHDDCSFTISEDEQEILRDYLEAGGFIWIDSCLWTDQYNTLIFTIFPGMFDSDTIEYLDASSPIYNATYTFTSAPPSQWNSSTQIGAARVNGALVIISTPHDYFCQLDYPDSWGTDAAKIETALELAVNIALFASLQ